MEYPTKRKRKIKYKLFAKIADCVTEVENKKVNIAFIVNSTKINQVRQVAESGNIMPQKSTFLSETYFGIHYE